MDHHISIICPYVRARPENDVQHRRREDHHDQPGQKQGPARQRRSKLIGFLHLVLRLFSILLLRWIVVPGCRDRVRRFVPVRAGGPRLEFGYIPCHAGPRGFAKTIRGGSVRTGNVISTIIKNTVRAPRIRKVSLVDKIVTCCSTAWRKASRLFGMRGWPSGVNGGGYWGSTPLLWITRQRSWPASSMRRSECSALRQRSINATNQALVASAAAREVLTSAAAKGPSAGPATLLVVIISSGMITIGCPTAWSSCQP